MVYRDEKEVDETVRQGGIPREKTFVKRSFEETWLREYPVRRRLLSEVFRLWYVPWSNLNGRSEAADRWVECLDPFLIHDIPLPGEKGIEGHRTFNVGREGGGKAEIRRCLLGRQCLQLSRSTEPRMSKGSTPLARDSPGI
ncbi:hypothetical protein C8Q78DRAFT_390286 [Trametes maxima]|nr:hypothetical protein C8Q78DRAFT_390286 [Trametes maxima]